MPIKETEPQLLRAFVIAFFVAVITALLRSVYHGERRSFRRILAGAMLSGVAALIVDALVLRYFTLTSLELALLSAFSGYMGAELIMTALYEIARRKAGLGDEDKTKN